MKNQHDQATSNIFEDDIITDDLIEFFKNSSAEEIDQDTQKSCEISEVELNILKQNNKIH